MADYKSMYYELLLSSERAIQNLLSATSSANTLLPPERSDYFDAYNSLQNACHDIVKMIVSSVQKSEDIYIETCDDDPESQD